MAFATGLSSGFSGSVGGLTFSKMKDGTTVVSSKNKKSEKPLTTGQLSVCMDTTITAVFIKSIKNFVNTGYQQQAKLDKISQYNSMVRQIRTTALTGEYPERKIDFTKLLVTKGKMTPPENAVVSLNEFGLVFSWDAEVKNKDTHYSDQVMLMAYFPGLTKSVYKITGAQRDVGKDSLNLTGIKKGFVAEIYISFTSDDHSNISNSIYLGQLNW